MMADFERVSCTRECLSRLARHQGEQGGVMLTYTVGRSATAVKVLTREILSFTLDLLLKPVLDL